MRPRLELVLPTNLAVQCAHVSSIQIHLLPFRSPSQVGRSGPQHPREVSAMPFPLSFFHQLYHLTILSERASLVAQWLRIRLPMQGIRVRALIQEDPTC